MARAEKMIVNSGPQFQQSNFIGQAFFEHTAEMCVYKYIAFVKL